MPSGATTAPMTDRTVDVYILRLRQKIETDSANPKVLRSVRGFGYSFDHAGTEVAAVHA